MWRSRKGRDPRRIGALRRLLGDTRGATAVEYGLIAAVIVVAMIASFVEVAKMTTGIWNNVSTKVTTAR